MIERYEIFQVPQDRTFTAQAELHPAAERELDLGLLMGSDTPPATNGLAN